MKNSPMIKLIIIRIPSVMNIITILNGIYTVIVKKLIGGDLK